MRLLSLLLAVVITAACGAETPRPRLLKHGALNDPILIGLPRALDATSLTASAVRLLDHRGRELAWRAETRGRELTLFAVIGVEQQHAAAEGWRVVLAGFPSPHALRWDDAGLLAETWSAQLQPELVLQPGRASPPRLVAVDGAAVDSSEDYSVGAEVELHLAGVFDPSALRAEFFPLRPRRGELLLDSLLPEFSAQVVDERTRLRITLPEGEPELLLRTREWELHDVAGRRLDPSVVIRLSRH
ncbi:MAG: hypothetical protein DHS20C15_22270 [Planctomycetota bacterium]|nr:MAG: hypothetical protein DHS20C15_22270 [Planctomycetota bacterium]